MLRAFGVAALLLGACDAPRQPAEAEYPHAREAIGTVREIYDGTLSPELAVATFRNTHRLFPTRRIVPAAVPRPLPPAAAPLIAALGELRMEHDGRALGLDSILALNRITGLLVLQDGSVVLERYRLGNTPATRWMSMSIAKSVLVTLFGAALREGAIATLDAPVTQFVPALAGSAYDGVSVEQVLAMRSGVHWTERYTDSTSDRRRLLEAQIEQRPGALLDVMRSLPRAAPPGTRAHYSTGETQVAAAVLRAAVGMPLAEYLESRIWQRAGMEAAADWWLDAPDGVEIGGSGLSATLRDYGRFGQLVLENGVVGSDTLLPPGWMRDATRARSTLETSGYAYGLLWWPAATALARANGAFTAEGIHGQFVHVDPTARVVIVQWAARPEPQGGEALDDLAFFDAIVGALDP